MNSELRSELSRAAKNDSREAYLPSPWLCTDNAAMIACAGYHKFKKLKGAIAPFRDIDPGLTLRNWN